MKGTENMKMKTNNPVNMDYPRLESQPEYRAAADKLAQVVAERRRLQRELKAVEAARHGRFSASLAGSDAIKQGEAMLAGGESGAGPIQIEKIRHALQLIENAINTQKEVVRIIELDLSRKAAKRCIGQHKAIVTRQIDAVLELYRANEAERCYLAEFDKLGYLPTVLPTRGVYWDDLDPYDEFGPTYARLKVARAYVGDTGEQ
jgi:hypothetical protein